MPEDNRLSPESVKRREMLCGGALRESDSLIKLVKDNPDDSGGQAGKRPLPVLTWTPVWAEVVERRVELVVLPPKPWL